MGLPLIQLRITDRPTEHEPSKLVGNASRTGAVNVVSAPTRARTPGAIRSEEPNFLRKYDIDYRRFDHLGDMSSSDDEEMARVIAEAQARARVARADPTARSACEFSRRSPCFGLFFFEMWSGAELEPY